MNLRSAVLGSLVLHGGLLVALGAGGGGGAAKAPAPPRITWEPPSEVPLEPDLPPLETEAPVDTSALPTMPDLGDPPTDAVDPRFAVPEGPPGLPGDGEVIGVSALDGRRPGGAARPPAAGPKAPPVPEEPTPAPDPVFLPPRLTVDRAPTYPPSLRRRGVEGKVRLRIEIAADGTIRATAVAVSSGHEALDAAALEAAAGWRFEPATEDGRPIAATVYRWVSFGLTDGR